MLCTILSMFWKYSKHFVTITISQYIEPVQSLSSLAPYTGLCLAPISRSIYHVHLTLKRFSEGASRSTILLRKERTKLVGQRYFKETRSWHMLLVVELWEENLFLLGFVLRFLTFLWVLFAWHELVMVRWATTMFDWEFMRALIIVCTVDLSMVFNQ